MVEEHTKNKMLMIEGMLVIGILIFVAAFALDKYLPTAQVAVGSEAPGVVGFVPVEIKSQQIELIAKEPTSFVLFSDKSDIFDLTSFRISGEVIGEGRAEIVIDNGLGQELLIYSNVKQKQGNMITGLAVSGDETTPLPEGAQITDVPTEEAWLRVTPSEYPIKEKPYQELGDNRRADSGQFQHTCVDTCYMNMKMQRGLYYTLKVRVDPGTEVVINELKYMLEV